MKRVPQAASSLGSLDKGCLPGSADTGQPEMELRALETPEDGDAEVRGDRREAERQSRKKQRERRRIDREIENTDRRREKRKRAGSPGSGRDSSADPIDHSLGSEHKDQNARERG